MDISEDESTNYFVLSSMKKTSKQNYSQFRIMKRTFIPVSLGMLYILS